MGYPTLVIDNSAGATDGQVSGCGPSTAVYGSNGRVVTGLATHVVFSSASELATGVAADHVLYLGTGSTNRRFSKITTVRTDYVTTACSWTADDTAVTVTSTTGLNVGDVVLINSSYYVIASILTSTTLTCTGLDQSGSYSGTLYRYSQVIVEDSMTVGSGYAWAIGGKLPGMTYGTHPEALRIWADGKAGWTIDVQYGTGSYLTGTTAITLSCAGSASALLKITSSSTSRPVLYTASNVEIFKSSAAAMNYIEFSNLGFQHTGTANYAIYASMSTAGATVIVDNCTFEGDQAVFIGGGSTASGMVRHCTFKNCNYAVRVSNSAQAYVTGCLVYATGTPTSKYGIFQSSSSGVARVTDTVFYNINYGAYDAATGQTDDWSFENCTFHTIANDAIKSSATTATYCLLRIRNCIFWSVGGYGVNPAVNINGQLRGLHGCAYGSVTSGLTNTSYLAAPSDAIVLTGDPCVDAASLDFRLDATSSEGAACRGVGFPSAVPYSSTRNDFSDIGALQRQFPTLPTAAQVQTGVQFGDDGTQYTGTYAGSGSGGGGCVIGSGVIVAVG